MKDLLTIIVSGGIHKIHILSHRTKGKFIIEIARGKRLEPSQH